MQYEVPQVIFRLLFALLVFGLVEAIARPPHFEESNQVISSDSQDPTSNLIDSGLKPWQVDLLVQRMAELNQLNNQVNPEFGYDRPLRSFNNQAEIKRQSRYRLCYFNPVSCFKK